MNEVHWVFTQPYIRVALVGAISLCRITVGDADEWEGEFLDKPIFVNDHLLFVREAYCVRIVELVFFAQVNWCLRLTVTRDVVSLVQLKLARFIQMRFDDITDKLDVWIIEGIEFLVLIHRGHTQDEV